MALTQLPIPQLNLIPFEIPEHIHPIFTHFIVVIPIVILIIELYNQIVKRKSITILNFIFIILLAIVTTAGIYTGLVDAKDAQDIESAKDLLMQHKANATYIIYGVGLLIIFKLASTLIKSILLKVLYILYLIVLIALILYNGKLGGSLVYDYGVNVKEYEDNITKVQKNNIEQNATIDKNITQNIEDLNTTKDLNISNIDDKNGSSDTNSSS